jgi:ATP-binding cassette subfamily F protein 2
MGKKSNKGTPIVAEPFVDVNEVEKEPIITNVAVSHGKANADEANWRTVAVEQLSITFHGQAILEDASLKLHAGNRYGLLGPNGCGKSTLLKCIAAGEIHVNDKIDFFYVDKEAAASEESALQAVVSVDREKDNLEKEADSLACEEGAAAADRLTEIYARLDELDADTAEMRAGRILGGLGFTAAMQEKKCREYSGGWRMRIALAQGLFINPTLLLLDEPSNHLDIEAVVWLEEYLKHFEGILLVISHAQDFLNNVCTNIIRLHQKKLMYYKGNYDTYVQTRMEQEEHQNKRFNWEQEQIKHMKEYIARFGHGHAKLARQAQSKEKTLAKMTEAGLQEKISTERAVTFSFPDPGKLAPPVLQFQNVTFNYPGGKPLYKNLNFGIDLDSRIALVGPNGAGKTTLQKLMCKLLEATDGAVSRNGHLRMARFAQHFVDQLPFDCNPIEYMQKEFPGDFQDIQSVRQVLGRFGVSGMMQMQKVGTLSEGQKARVVFAWMAWKQPHILLLDEPTNCLDMETIDALADAIQAFEGGVVLVSHDIRLISQVAEEIWIVENGKVDKFNGDIAAYKEEIRRRMEKAAGKK